jgi:DNA-binding GntR family transcriptional regulator
MNERETSGDDLQLREDGKRVPAAERVLDFILAEMDAGRLGPGSRVNAARIAGTLGLSAAPVREALSILAGRGVLELLPDRGAIMRPFSAQQVTQMWEVIAAVGAVGLRLAARAVTAGADASEVVARYRDIGGEPLAVSPVAFLLRLNGYHWAVHRLGGNEFVTPALERLGVPYWDRYLADLIDIHANIEGYLTNYRRMHEAVMSGDGEAAAAVMHYHADWSIQLIRQRTEREGDIKRRRRKAAVP